MLEKKARNQKYQETVNAVDKRINDDKVAWTIRP
jgi:hypothetical protein